jgi:hypothetical protein
MTGAGADISPKRLRQIRLFEACRESGTLLMTFTPLDAAITRSEFEKVWPLLMILFGFGVALYLTGLFGESQLHVSV